MIRRPRTFAGAVVVVLLALTGVAWAQTDPLLGQQWHLLPRTLEPAGANVRDVWPTTKGLGVTIGIVDDGIQATHPDLSPNLNATLSRARDGGAVSPPSPISCNPALLGNDLLGDGCRGTAVAGLAAARDNTLGVSGVAPRATLVGQRFLLGGDSGFFLPDAPGGTQLSNLNDANLRSAIEYQIGAIHIKNFSFGPPDDGATLVGPGPLSDAALLNAVTTGRGGRGTVLVWAAGNGGSADNCNFDGFANHRAVIAVGAVGDDALPAPYSEACSALFVVAPSSGGQRSLTTTDLLGAPGFDPANGDYTDRFGSTAASAPIVSGVVALMLAANPNLRVRDVKHILRQSSFRLEPEDTGPEGWTPGPFPHHPLFGFGLIDARAAVTTAMTWTLVAPEVAYPALTDPPLSGGTGQVIPDADPAGASDTITVDAPAGFTVEQVEVVLNVSHLRRGDLEVTLTSPNGVVSTLATLRPADTNADFPDWRFGSVRHWGEPAMGDTGTGQWTLTVRDRVAGEEGSFNAWTLRLYGTAAPPGIVASGRVTTATGPLAGVTLTFTEAVGGPVPAPVRTDVDGTWSQSGFAAGGAYTVTPSLAGFAFAPASLTFDASRNDLDFVAAPGCGATPIAPGQTLTGMLAVTDCRATQRGQSFADRFTFNGIAGQQVAITMSSTALDAFLYLLRGNSSVGFTALAFNDDSGNSLNARIPANTGFLTLPATDTYTIEATSFGASAVGAYTVMLTAASGFSVSGNVSTTGGVGLVGVTLTFTRDGGGTAPPPVQTDGRGAWSQTGFTPGQGYTVTPARNGFTFAPLSLSFSGAGTDLAFVGTAVGCSGTAITVPQTVAGTLVAGDCLSALRPGAFADRYTFTGSVAQQVAIALTSTAFDTFVYLIGPAGGAPIALNDDSGGTLNSRIPATAGFFTLPAAGVYTIEVTSFAGGATGAYSLMVTTAATTGFRAAGRVVTATGAPVAGVSMGFAREGGGTAPPAVSTDTTGAWSQAGFVVGTIYRVTPGRPGLSFAPANQSFSNTSATLDFVAAPAVCSQIPIAVGQTLSGAGVALGPTDCGATQRPGAFADQYRFAGTAGDRIAIAMASTAFDTVLFLIGPGGTLLALNDDSGGTLNSRIPATAGFFTLPTTGPYTIEATSFAPNAIGAYTLSLIDAAGFSAAGRVTTLAGAGVPGVTMTFSEVTGTGASPDPVTTDASGAWSQTLFTPGFTYRVRPDQGFTRFNPVSRDFSGGATNLNFTVCPVVSVAFNQPVSVSGMLATTDCTSVRRPGAFADRYAFTVPAGGGQVTIGMTSTTVDTYLYLFRADGLLLFENDDSNGTRNARLPFDSGLLLLPAGNYVIEATSFGAGVTGAYTLSLASPAANAFVTSGRVVTSTGLAQAGVTISFGATGGTAPPAVLTDASGRWSQTFTTGASYQATATRSGFDYAPAPSAAFTGPQSNVDFTGTPSTTNCGASTPIAFGQSRTGTLAGDDCLATDRPESFSDRYAFSVPAGAPAQVVITMSSTTFDTYLYLRDLGSGLTVAEDDDSGGGTNSRLIFQQVPPGSYEIQATSYSGATVGSYTLTLGPVPGTFIASGYVSNNGFPMSGVTMSFTRVTGTGAIPAAVVTGADGSFSQAGFAPSSTYRVTPALTGFVFTPPSQTFPAAGRGLDELYFEATCPTTPIAFGQTRSGTIAATDCRASDDGSISADRYAFEATAGTPVAISMTSSAFDTFLVLYGPSGDIIALNDESGGPGPFNSRIPQDFGFLELPESGQYVVEASPLGPGAIGAYSITLTVASDRFEASGFVTQDGFFGLENATVTFTRIAGTGPIPPAVRTDVDGVWVQTGFAYGTTYRARVTVAGMVFAPPSYDFASPFFELNFIQSGAGCVATALALNQAPRAGRIQTGDCVDFNAPPDGLYDRYTFTATAGSGVQVLVQSSDFFPFIGLIGPDGLFVDFVSGGTLPSTGDLMPLPLTGTYVIDMGPLISGTEGNGNYTIQILNALGVQAPPAPPPPPSGDAITAQFWTSVGEGAAEGDGVSGDALGAGAPAIAVDPVNGEIFMAWESGDSDIHVKKWNGATWVEVGAGSATGGGLISDNAGQSRFPSIAIKQATLGQPGQPVVAWIDDTSGAWEIYVREFNGTTWVPAGSGTPDSGPGISNALGQIQTAEAGRPSLVAERGNLFVAYATDQGLPETHRVVVAALRPLTGWAPLAANPLGANVAVAGQEYTTPGYAGARAPAVAINRTDGQPISAYVTGNAAVGSELADVHVRRWSPTTWAAFGAGAASNAGISGSEPRPNGYTLTSPRIATGPDGVPHAAWLSDVGGNRSIQVRRFSSAANAWQPLGESAAAGDLFLPTAPGAFGAALALAVGRDNQPVVAWSAGAAGDEIHVRKFSPLAGWHEVGPGSATGGGVSDNAGLSRFPALAVDTHNGLNVPILTWLDTSGGLPQVYVRRAVSNADLIVESVAAPTGGAAGQGLDVTVVVRNAGAVAAPAFAVGLYLADDNVVIPGESRLLTLQPVPGGLAAGAQTTLTVRVTVPANVLPGAYFVGAFADAGTVVDEVDESNNGRTSPNIIQIAGPDLIVAALNGPFTATPGQNLAVEVSVKNQAQPPGTAAASRVAIYLSTDPTPGTGVRLGAAPINALTAGASQTLTVQLMVPGNTSPDTYFLSAIADELGQVAESAEGNNGFNSERPVQIVQPDVLLTQVTAPTSGAAGQSFVISSDVKNQAAAPPAQAVTIGKQPPPQPAMAGTSAAFRVNFFLSASSTAVQPGDPMLGGRDVTALAPGITSRASTTITVPANVSAGTYFVLAVADAAGGVQEQDETNNTRAASNPIVIRQPDLIVTEVRGPVSGLGAAGQPLAVSVKVKNQALAPANAGAFRVGVYLSLDSTPGSGDFVGFIPVASLAAGVTTASLTAMLPVPAALLDNTYFLSAVADWDGRVAEGDEDNNGLTAAQAVTIGRPDLAVTRVTGPATSVGAAGQPLAVTLGVKNQGAAPANAGPFRVGVYLSLTDTPGAGTLIGNVSVTGVVAGATATVPATVVVPASFAAGTYFLSAVADLQDVIAESDEGNNGLTAASQMIIRQPDLLVTEVKGPASGMGAAGQPLPVSLRVKNQGTAPANAGPFRVGIYLSTNQSAGTGLLLGNLSVNGVVAGALPLAVTGSVPVPASVAAGSYFLSAVADVDDRIGETNEDNNGLTAAASITIGRPDLQIGRIAGPATAVGASGQPLAVSLDVRNDAPVPANAGPFRVGVYLSLTNTSATGTLIGTLNVAGLAAGARTTLTATLPVPANVSAASYFLVAAADIEDRVVESDEANNELGTVATLAIRQPDLRPTLVTGPTTWSPGQPFVVTTRVINEGQAPATAGLFRVGAYLSDSPTPGSGTLVGFATVTTLAAGVTTPNLVIPVTVPPSLAPGSYSVSVVADHDGRVFELEEADNGLTAAAQVQIRRADLAVTVLGGPPTGVRGKMIAVANTVANVGNAAATAVRVSFFVSPISAAPGAGRLIGTRDVATLAAMSVSAVTTSVTLPANLEPGSYFLSAVVDVAGTIAEGAENNNGLTAPLQILVTAQ